jgi:Protein of unknown function (DUF3551)
MTRSDRVTVLSASAFAIAALLPLALAATSAPAVAAGAPPFCVARGGFEGSSPPQVCAYYDYQACLQAAADLRGNCVQNIDYHDEVSTAPASKRARHRR